MPWTSCQPLVAAAGGPEDIKEKMLTDYQGHKAHLDGYNQLDMLTGKGPSNRKEIIYYLATFEEWPPASRAAKKNAEKLDETLESTGGVGQ